MPWTLEVTAMDDGSPELTSRRWMLAAGFALLAGLLGTVSLIVARAAGKEVAVARLQTDFVSAVSHEFRSPLSSICQISELLNEDRWPSDEYRRRSFEILGRESARLRRLVEGLLDFARMESGAVQYRFELLVPGELVQSLVGEFQAQTASRGRKVHLSMAPGLPDIHADREALGRALWNLLDNAGKYSPDSSDVEVEVAMESGRLAIRVRDEGPGIPVEEQKDIFLKFVRGSRAKASGVKGTGIGLAMVRHIVEGHGGEIRLESKPGSGSTFTILLPVGRLT
jgi:signal transduction histidine kinase